MRTAAGRSSSGFFTLHVNGKASYVRGAGVKLPAVGVGLKVLRQSGTSMTVKLFKTK